MRAGPVAAERPHRDQLAALTGAKVVTNTALRWVGPFLPTLERAFSASTGTLTGIMGVSELAGLSTLATGRYLDRGHERRMFVIGTLAVAGSSIIALIGTVPAFAVAFALLIVGVTNLTVAGHAWIGHRVPFAARGRSIGLFETSWALALLIGAPMLALLIRWFGWRGPFVALAIASVAAAIVVHRAVAPGTAARNTAAGPQTPLPRTAWFPMIGSAAIAAAGLGIFVVSGAWLDDVHGVSTGGLGVIATMFGAIELVSSSSVAGFGDRIGSKRSVLVGLVALFAGLCVIQLGDDARIIGVVGLIVFLAGFEFAFVSSLTLVTEAAPEARGRAIGISNALGTLARAVGIVASGQIYESVGMSGSLVLSGVCASAAVVLIGVTRSPTTS